MPFLGLLSLAASVIVLSVSTFFTPISADEEFAQEIERCNKLTTQERFSCFRVALENYRTKIGAHDLGSFVERVEGAGLSFASENKTYAIFGTNCHTFYHALGDFIATQSDEEVGQLVNYCPLACTSGCVMGLYKRTALEHEFSTEILKEYYRSCRKAERVQCSHEIGHLLHDKYTTALLKTVDELTLKNYGFHYPQEYKYQLFDEADLNAPFTECREIIPEGELVRQCYTGVGHNMFVFTEFSPEGYKSQLDECSKKAAGDDLENCYAFLLFRIGINDAATRFLSYNFEDGRKVCDESVALINREDLKYHCYVGLGGGLGLFLESEYPYKEIIDANLAQVRNELAEYARLCEQAPEEFVENCFKGLLGTRAKTLFKDLNVQHPKIQELLPELDEFQVTG